MKVIHTLPNAYFHLQEQYSDGYLILAHEFLQNPTYKKLVMERVPKWTIADNGAYEKGRPVDFKELIDIAHQINADVLVLPDVFYDMKATLNNYEKFLKHAPKDIQLLAPVQGTTPAEILKCFLELYLTSEIDIIGLSFLVCERCFSQVTGKRGVAPNRIFFVRLLCRLGLTQKRLHLLGCGNPDELICQRRFPFVFSFDSSVAYVATKHRVRLWEDIHFEREDFSKLNLNEKPDLQVEHLIKNMKAVSLAGGAGWDSYIREEGGESYECRSES